MSRDIVYARLIEIILCELNNHADHLPVEDKAALLAAAVRKSRKLVVSLPRRKK